MQKTWEFCLHSQNPRLVCVQLQDATLPTNQPNQWNSLPIQIASKSILRLYSKKSNILPKSTASGHQSFHSWKMGDANSSAVRFSQLMNRLESIGFQFPNNQQPTNQPTKDKKLWQLPSPTNLLDTARQSEPRVCHLSARSKNTLISPRRAIASQLL